MKINLRKIASVLATTVMLGSTISFAAAAWTPFVKSDGTNDGAIVVGASAASTDLVAATDLGAEMDKSITAATSASLSGEGDKANVDSGSRKIYYGDQIDAAKSALSASEMPTVLADGKVVSLTGTEYSYTQSIKLGNTVSVFGTSGGDLNDPALYLNAGTTATIPIYNYTLSLNKNLNVSDDTNIQGQKIKILGVDYVIGASSTNSTLYLYGAGQTVNLNGGESKTVTIADKEHTVELVAATATNQAKLTVDGVSKTVTKGSSYSFTGDITVYVKDITYQSYAGGVQTAELIVGANTLLLQNGNSVKQGADQTSITGTLATITPAGTGLISGVTVSVAMKKSQTDHIGLGESTTDPVFGGLKVQLVKANPALMDSGRAKILLNTDNNQYAYVTFTSARAGSKGEQKLTYAYDALTDSSTIQPILAHQANTSNNRGVIHVYEGESAYLNDWIVVNQGDAGTILQVDDISFDTATSGTVTFSDAITGESQKITLTNNTADRGYTKTGVNFFGGNGYTIVASDGSATASVNITWSGAGVRTLSPRIKLKDGGWIAFLTQTTIVNGTNLIYPDGQTTLATTGTKFDNASLSYNANGIIWNGTATGAGAANNSIWGIGGANGCNFNVTKGPAILYIEPKKWDDTTFGSYICTPMTTAGTTEIAIGTPVFNSSNSAFQTYGSDTYKSAAVDKYGAFVVKESRTNENGVVTIYTPSSQMYLDVLFTASAVSASAKETIKVVKDSEVSSVSSKNLVVVGGSCINKAAAMILTGKEDALCGDGFASLTGAGPSKYLIQVAASPYNAEKVAMLVAGYEAAQTTDAVAKVKEGTTATTVGTKIVGPVTA